MSTLEFIDLFRYFQRLVSVKDRFYHMKLYRKCFVAADAITALLQHSKIANRAEAQSLCQEFIDAGLIRHCVDIKKPFLDESLFFEFTGQKPLLVKDSSTSTSSRQQSIMKMSHTRRNSFDFHKEIDVLFIRLISASNLTPQDSNGLSDPFVIVDFLNTDHITPPTSPRNQESIPSVTQSPQQQAQTRVIPKTLNPVWNESFVMCVPDNSVLLRICVMDHDLMSSNDYEGQILIPMSELSPGVIFDCEICILIYLLLVLEPIQSPPISLKKQYWSKDSQLGSIKFQVQYCPGAIPKYPYPLRQKWKSRYEQLDTIVSSHRSFSAVVLTLSQMMDRKQLEHYIQSFMTWMRDLYRLSPSTILADVVKSCIRYEVNTTSTPTTLFRHNSFSSKILVELGRGGTFLADCLNPLVQKILQLEDPLEVDPHRLDAKANLKKNQKKLLELVQLTSDSIAETVKTSCPQSIRFISHQLAVATTSKWPDKLELAVVGFLYLRIINPAITTPQNFPFAKNTKFTIHQQRTLLLVAKILQKAGNAVLFTHEKWLHFSNPFVKQAWSQFVDVCSIASKPFLTTESSTITPSPETYDPDSAFHSRVQLHKIWVSLIRTPTFNSKAGSILAHVICAHLQESIPVFLDTPDSFITDDSSFSTVPTWVVYNLSRMTDMIEQWSDPPKTSYFSLHDQLSPEIQKKKVIHLDMLFDPETILKAVRKNKGWSDELIRTVSLTSREESGIPNPSTLNLLTESFDVDF